MSSTISKPRLGCCGSNSGPGKCQGASGGGQAGPTFCEATGALEARALYRLFVATTMLDDDPGLAQDVHMPQRVASYGDDVRELAFAERA